jgi:hypothetical protein
VPELLLEEALSVLFVSLNKNLQNPKRMEYAAPFEKIYLPIGIFKNTNNFSIPEQR